MIIEEITRELIAAKIPIDGVCSDGRIDFRPEATESQRSQARQIVDEALKNPAPLILAKKRKLLRAQIDGILEAALEENHGNLQRDVITLQALNAHLKGNVPPAAWDTMVSDMQKWMTWRADKLVSIKAATTEADLEAIDLEPDARPWIDLVKAPLAQSPQRPKYVAPAPPLRSRFPFSRGAEAEPSLN